MLKIKKINIKINKNREKNMKNNKKRKKNTTKRNIIDKKVDNFMIDCKNS
jgi:hypothetical protein